MNILTFTMKYFLSKMRSAVFVTALCVYGFFACTTAQIDFGVEYLPDEDKLEVLTTTLTGTVGYHVSRDSIPTSVLGNVYLGSIVTPYFGAVDFDFFTNYLPGSFGTDNADSLWGDYPAIDSVFLVFQASMLLGDTVYSDMVVTVRELDKALPKDKYQMNEDTLYYYSNFNIEPYLSDDILTQFEIKGSEYAARIELPLAFGERFLDTNGMIYIYDSLFIEKFLGLHFETNKVDSRGVVKKMDMSESYIQIYYNNQNPGDKDTTSVNMYLDYTSDNRTQQFNMINRRYELADPILGIDYSTVGDTLTPQDKIYIQSLGGVMSQVEFSRDEIQQIKDDAIARGYTDIAINSAVITFNVNVPSISNLATAFDRLGMMYDVSDCKEYSLIGDYYPYDEGEDSESTPNFDGYLNRALNKYSMNITSLMQTLINGSEDYSVLLMPAYGRELEYSSVLQLYGVVLDGGGVDGSFNVDVTYTLIK